MASTATDTSAASVVEGSDGLLLEIDGKIVPNYDATITPFEEGEVITGTVVWIDATEVLVDVKYKSEGVIPNNELSIRKSVDPFDEVELGELVDVLVLQKEDQDGRLLVSKKRARFERAWKRIEAAAESGEPVEGTVIEVVKGGLIVDLGVRGFLPASLVDIRRVSDLDEFGGTLIECKVIEINRQRNNVVLSRRAVLEEERKEQRQEILDTLQPGAVVEGQISNIVDFGSFVDLNGIDGLIHISELSWSHVNHPSEVVAIGDTVQVKVLDIDRDRQRISLGLKQTQEDPWQRVVNTYRVGDELEGKVTKAVTFGAFVEILDGVEGLVHISELAEHHVENPREVVSPGDDIRVKILEIDEDRRRLSLSVKRVEGQVLPSQQRAEAGEEEPESQPGAYDDGDEESQATASGGAGRAGGDGSGARRGGRRRHAGGRDGGGGEPRGSGGRGPGPRRSRRGRPGLRGLGARRPRGPGARRRCGCPDPRGPGARRRRGHRSRGRQRRGPGQRGRPAAGVAAARGRLAPGTPGRGAEPSAVSEPVPFLGLTGGLGAGKSTALRALEALGARTLSTDRVVHDLYGRADVLHAVRSRWGEGVVADNTVDRAAVARRVFGEPAEREWLEGLLWPLVGREVQAFREAAEAAEPAPRAAVVETPLLFEAGMAAAYEATIAITAPEDLRRERAAVRGHESVDERAARQLTQDEKAARATYAVINDGDEARLHERLAAVLDRHRAGSRGPAAPGEGDAPATAKEGA